MATATGAVQLASQGVDTAKKSLELLNQVLDTVIPWKEFRQTMQALKDHRDQYSDQAGKVVGEVATLLLNSSDSYVYSVNSVDKWCKSAAQLLQTYIELFSKISNPMTAEAQKALLLVVLKDGSDAIAEAQREMKKSNEQFNAMTGKLKELRAVLKNDFHEGSAYFDSAVKAVRVKAYAGASASVATVPFLGPIGLAVAYAVAAGVAEGSLIPALKKSFEETEKSFNDLSATLDKAQEAITKARQDIKAELTTLDNIESQIRSTHGYAIAWAKAPPALFQYLKESTEKLIQMCKDYTADAARKRANNWV
mgnify:FL=1